MGWKSKLIVLLFFYSAGFSTAIYIFGPQPPNSLFKSGSHEVFNFEAFQDENLLKGYSPESEKFVKSFNAGLHKGVDISKDTIRKLTALIKEKSEQKNAGQTGFR